MHMSFLDNYVCPWNNLQIIFWPQCSVHAQNLFGDPPSASPWLALLSTHPLPKYVCVISVWLLLAIQVLVSHVRQPLGFEKNTAFQAALISPGPYSARTSKSRTYHLFCTHLLIFPNSFDGWLFIYFVCLFIGREVLFLTASNSLLLFDLKPHCDLSPGILCAGPILLFNLHQKFKHWLLLMIFHSLFWITSFFYPHCHHSIAMDTH